MAVSNVIGPSNEGLTATGNGRQVAASLVDEINNALTVAGNGGVEAAGWEASYGEESTAYATASRLLEQEEGSGQMWAGNEAYSEENGMEMEAGQAWAAEDNDLLLVKGSRRGDANEASDQRGENGQQINLEDPASFPPLRGGRADAFTVRAIGVSNERPSSLRSADVAGVRSPPISGDNSLGGSPLEAKRKAVAEG